MSWRAISGTSDPFATLLARLQQEPRNQELLHKAILSSMDVLFGRKSLPEVDRKKALEQANRVSNRYLRYYHHAVPFDRSVLIAAWNACTGAGCESGKRQVEQWAGRLESTKSENPRRRKADRRRRKSDAERETLSP